MQIVYKMNLHFFVSTQTQKRLDSNNARRRREHVANKILRNFFWRKKKKERKLKEITYLLGGSSMRILNFDSRSESPFRTRSKYSCLISRSSLRKKMKLLTFSAQLHGFQRVTIYDPCSNAARTYALVDQNFQSLAIPYSDKTSHNNLPSSKRDVRYRSISGRNKRLMTSI